MATTEKIRRKSRMGKIHLLCMKSRFYTNKNLERNVKRIDCCVYMVECNSNLILRFLALYRSKIEEEK